MDSLARSALISSVHSTLLPKPHARAIQFSLPLASGSAPSTILTVRASRSPNPPSPLAKSFKSAATRALILTAGAAALLSWKLSPPPARADPSAAPAAEERVDGEVEIDAEPKAAAPALAQFLESSSDAIDSLRSLVYQKLEEGDDSEALALLRRLMAAQPADTEWKFLAARLLSEMGDAAESRRLFEEILAVDPLSFEALFENAVLMDRCGEGEAVIERLERALELARSENKEKAARDVRLIMAQIQFLQRNIDEALASYEELAKEDPKDYRPYFCQGVIYSLIDRNKEAREKFSKYHELSPRKFDVDAYLQTPLSRMKLCGTGDSAV